MAEVFDNRRVFTVPKPDFSDMEKLISEVPYNHDGLHIELFYNLIFSQQDITLPDHLRPVIWVLGDKNIDAAMLIISPGAGKSLLCDVAWPCYEIGYDPTTSIMGVSSGADLMVDFLQTSMGIIEENEIYKLLFPNVIPDENSGWSTSRGIFVKRPATGQVSPSYQATGYGSRKITGKHAKVILIDDIHDQENCLDKETEVLTKRGWLLFKDTNMEDDFATRNPETHEFEWQKPLKLIENDFDGELVHFNSRGLDLLVTPNHRMIVTHRMSQKSEYIISAQELSQKRNRCLPTTSIWNGKEIDTVKFLIEKPEKINKLKPKRNSGRQRIGTISICEFCESSFYKSPSHIKPSVYCSKICADNSKINLITMSGDDYCAFMGMYLSEGSCKERSVSIAQKEYSKGFNDFKELIFKIFNKDYYYDGNQFYISSALLVKYLLQFGYSLDKFIPQIIKDASSRQIEIFIKYYILGDGHKDEIYTSSKRMADDLQELYQKTGYYASIKTKQNLKNIIICGKEVKAENCHNSYTISKHFSKFTHKPKNYISVQKHERVSYQDKVYCASVPNKTLYVRRNGYATWVGNSGTADQIEKVEDFFYKTLIGRQDPKGSRMIMVGRRWAEDDLYGRLKKSGDWLTMTLASIRETSELYYDMRIPAGLSCIFNDFQAKETVEDIKVVYGENTEQPGFYWKGMVAKYKEALLNKKNKPAIYETVYQSNPEAVGSKIFRAEDFQDFYLPEDIALGRNSEQVLNFMGKMQFDMILQSWDTGLTAESRNDPSCCYTIGIRSCGEFHRGEDKDKENTLDEMPFHYDIYVLDEWYGRLEIGDLEKEAVNYFNMWNPNQVIVENSIAGIPLIQNLSQFSISVVPVKVQNISKKSRSINGANAGSAQGWSRSGRIFIPRNAPWANELLKELDDFSGAKGKRDDRVDALVQAVNFSIDFGVLNRELPPGWRTEKEIQARMQSIMAPNHPFMQIPHMMDNQVNVFYGYCGTCKMFDKTTSTCKLHKRKVTKLDSCYAYDAETNQDAKVKVADILSIYKKQKFNI